MEFWRTPAFRWTALLGGTLTWRLILFIGPQGSDDLAYSEAAWTLAGGKVPLDQGIHGSRIGYVGCLAFVYALFGAGSFSLILPNLAASLAEVALARVVAREFLDDAGAWIAAALVAILPVHVFFASEAHPDMPAAALTTLSALLFLKAKAADRTGLFLLSGAVLGGAHLVKESAFMGLAALAALGGRARPRFLLAPAGFAAVVAAECLFFWVLSGDPLHRIHGVRVMQTAIMNSEYYVQSIPTFRRLVVDVPAMLLWPGHANYPFFTLLPLLSIAGAVHALRRGDAALRGPMIWAIAVAALLILWPISLVPYRPAMVAFPRIFLPIAVPLAILAASLLRTVPLKVSGAILLVVSLAAVCGSLILHSDGRRESAGARLAWVQTGELPVVSDPRTIQFFRLYDGYSARRPLHSWNQPTPTGPHDRVVNGIWIRNLWNWNRVRPPSGFEDPGVPPTRTELIPGRVRLRPLLRGRLERLPPEELRIYRLP